MSLLHHHALIKGGAVGPTWQFDENDFDFYLTAAYDNVNDWIKYVAGHSGAGVWQAGAISKATGAEGIRGEVFSRTHISFDLGSVNKSSLLNDYGWNVTTGTAKVYETAIKFTKAGIINGDEMKILFEGGVIKYYIKSVLEYTSLIPPAGNYYSWFATRNLSAERIDSPRILI